MYFNAEIDNIGKNFPENLIFCNENNLVEIAQDDFNEEIIRANCLAELLIREYFSRDENLRSILSSVLSDSDIAAFLSAMPHNFFTPGDEERMELNGSSSLAKSCFSALRKRLKLLFRTDGIIPVVKANEVSAGWLIPFDIQDNNENPGVFDLSGKQILEWSKAVALLQLPTSINVRLHFHYPQSKMTDLTGHSLMLPVWAAYLRKNDRLPKYNPFQAIFTGAFDDDGYLAPVDTDGKIREITQMHPKATLFLPLDECGNPEQGNLRFLPQVKINVLETKLQHEVERLHDTLFGYAIKRLPSICKEVRSLQHADWNELILRLERNAAFDEDENPEEYLLNLMLQSEAHCHAGNTQRAYELNLLAQKTALENGFEKLLIRLQVNKLVLLTDSTNFEEIKTISPALEQMIEKSGDSDLLMRYHGTMGQIHAYGTLCNIDGCTKELSLRHFRIAKCKAFELGNLEDKRQDLNYLHLWHAIFMPGTSEEISALKRAEKMSAPHDGESDISDNRIRNICYLRRQQLFAWYRNYLLTGKTIEHEIPQDINVLLEGPNTWCRALSYKYLGTLASARGNKTAAEKYFTLALQPIQNEECPIIGFIKMTIYAEACRSLKNDNYRSIGQVLATRLLEEYSNPQTVTPWLEYFEHKKDSAPFATYWY